MSNIDHLIKAHKVATRIRVEKPTKVSELLVNCGLSLRYIESGAFRDVYRINNTRLIVKVPREDFRASMGYAHGPLEHSRIEWNYRRKVMKQKRYEFFRPYMPAYHYFCKDTGIMLVDHYKPLPHWEDKYDKHIKGIQAQLNGLGVCEGDIGLDKKDNYGIDRFGKLRILDLGCFGGELE